MNSVSHGGRLDGDAEALRLWAEIVPNLESQGRFKPEDSTGLAAMCSWYSRWRAADDVLREDPGDYKASMLAAMSWKNFGVLMSKFGLSPADRKKLEPLGDPKAAPVRSRNRKHESNGHV